MFTMADRTVAIKHAHPTLKSLGIAVEYYPGYVNRRLNLHSVDVVLLSFILTGHGLHYIDRTKFTESGGATLAVTHYGQKQDIVTDEHGMDVINVYLDLQNHVLPVLPSKLQRVVPMLLPLHPRFVHSLNRIVRIRFDDAQPPAQRLFDIQNEIQRKRVGWQEAVRLHWKIFLMQCCRQVLETGMAPPASEPSHLEAVRQHLDQNFAEAHTLEALAKRARLKPTSLCHAFKSYTGKRVFDYLIERRIQAAMARLIGGDEKVTDIALDCGFNDLAHFYRKFGQLVGVTPGVYRRRSEGG
jgi:AraC-like DNA-binding protein